MFISVVDLLIHTELDTVSPNITNCPDRDIIVIALSSEGGKNVTWRPPDVTDNSGNVTLTSVTPTPGSFFEFGETAIGYVFTDPSDNSAYCPIFTIAVVEGKFVTSKTFHDIHVFVCKTIQQAILSNDNSKPKPHE